MRAYVEFEIEEGAYDISCPDAQCEWSSILTLNEISSLVTPELMEKHHKFRLNRGLQINNENKKKKNFFFLIFNCIMFYCYVK